MIYFYLFNAVTRLLYSPSGYCLHTRALRVYLLRPTFFANFVMLKSRNISPSVTSREYLFPWESVSSIFAICLISREILIGYGLVFDADQPNTQTAALLALP